MKKENFNKLLAGMEDALAYAEGDASKGVAHAVEAVDVASIRKAQGLTQTQFAARYRLDLSTVRQWEQGRRRPDRASRLLLKVIERHPGEVAAVAEAS